MVIHRERSDYLLKGMTVAESEGTQKRERKNIRLEEITYGNFLCNLSTFFGSDCPLPDQNVLE